MKKIKHGDVLTIEERGLIMPGWSGKVPLKSPWYLSEEPNDKQKLII